MNVVPENVYWEQKRAFASIFIFFLSFAAPFFLVGIVPKINNLPRKKKKELFFCSCGSCNFVRVIQVYKQ